MGIEVHRSDRPQTLAREFAALLAQQPADPFTPEVVVVPARGVERWLAQQLSHSLGATVGDDGVCAGLQIMAPQSLIGLLLGRDRDDPWHADRLVWPALRAIDQLVGSPHFEALTHHLGAGPPITDDPRAEWERKARQSRRYAVARRVAGLFSSYARERPQLLLDWEAGRATDGQGTALPDDFLWQPILWRRTAELVVEAGDATESITARQQRVVDELNSGTASLDLPERISFFGYSRLATPELELLFALGTHREVHLWLPHPSPQLWTDLSAQRSTGTRVADESARVAHHPLLATLGRDVRELQMMLGPGDIIDHGAASSPSEETRRLSLLQNDIRANRAPDSSRPTTDDDFTVQVHACHGRARQVEVLREVLTWLLAEGKGDLQPRDILVMCPDIEQFAPLIQSAFGLSLVSAPKSADMPHHPGQQLRVQLADRSLGATNPLIDLAHRVVRLVAGRMTVSDVLDLAGHDSVRARFGFDQDALERIDRWVAESGVRWGYDGVHRGEYGLRDLEANTWTRGMDRMALGVAVSADTQGSASTLVPIDDVGSRDIEVIGRFLELLERVKAAADAVRGRGPAATRGAQPGVLSAADWMRWLRDTIGALAEVPTDDQWQLAQLTRDLTAIGDSAGTTTVLRLNDIRVMLEQRWGARPTRANFRTGAVTVCTMVPMRSVPHKAVVVLGVDDGVYPRSPITDGDDVLARTPLIGERDVRSEDRQLLLDAVMAADQYFVALYSGFDERTGARRPPAVPLQELIATAARTATAPADADAGSAAREPSFVRHHPLQAFDERNFRPKGPLPGGTFDRASLIGAEALRRFRAEPAPPPTLISGPLPAQPVSAVTVDELVAFFQNPAREFLRGRLEITVPREADVPDDSLPIAVDGLDKWQIGDRVLSEVLAGASLEDALDAEVVRGSFPPGDLADPVRTEIGKTVASIASEHGDGPVRSVDIRFDLPPVGGANPVRVTGVIGEVSDNTLWVRTYSTISAKHIITAWIRLLALAVAEPDREHSARLTGKKGGQQLRSPGAARSAELLHQLIEIRQSGMRFPMGVPPKTASRFAESIRRIPRDERPAATPGVLAHIRTEWEGNRFGGENNDPWWNLVLGRNSPVEALNRLRSLEYFAPQIWDPVHDNGGGS